MRIASVPSVLLLSAVWAGAATAGSLVVDFEDLSVPPEGYYNGADGAGGFTSRGAFFNNEFTDFGSFEVWEGWSYSTRGDTTTPGFENQFSSFAGGGAGGSETFGVAFMGSQIDPPPGAPISYIDLPEVGFPVGALSASVTNTTFAALSMRDGDSFTDPFGGATGDDPDFFKLTITGHSEIAAGGSVIGAVEVYLADFRFQDNTLDFILDEWLEVDLTALIGAESLGFRVDSSKRSTFGGVTFINTPAYVAFDNLTFTAVPEPSSLALTGLGLLAGLAWIARRRG